LRVGVKDEVAPLVVVLACEEMIEVSEDCKIEGVVLEGDELSDCEEDEVKEPLPVEQAVSSKVKNVAWVIFIN
jgi:hypothetical protein